VSRNSLILKHKRRYSGRLEHDYYKQILLELYAIPRGRVSFYWGLVNLFTMQICFVYYNFNKLVLFLILEQYSA
jgi:hypothetical protein